MDDSGYSSSPLDGRLLMTPVALEGRKATMLPSRHCQDQGHQVWLTNQIRDIYDLNQPAPTSSKATTGDSQTMRLLPTPEAKLGSSGPDYAKAARGSGGNDLQTTVTLHLLPTTRAQHGEDRNSNIYPRAMDQPQNLENALARLPGASTGRPSDVGNEPLDAQLPGQLNLLDAMADTD